MAEINYWPRNSKEKITTINADNVFYDPPEAKANRLVYSTKILNLKPDTVYDFRIRYSSQNSLTSSNEEQDDHGYIQSKIHSFRTFPNNPKNTDNFTVVFGGDIGNLNTTVDMHKMVARQNPYAAFIGGDIVYDRGFSQ
jgi:hypothetical protein